MIIDEDKIPKDMSKRMCMQFEVSRIDIWKYQMQFDNEIIEAAEHEGKV